MAKVTITLEDVVAPAKGISMRVKFDPTLEALDSAEAFNKLTDAQQAGLLIAQGMQRMGEGETVSVNGIDVSAQNAPSSTAKN